MCGEKEKMVLLRKKMPASSNIRLLPYLYGRWGKLFEEYIQAYCQRAAGNDTKLYNVTHHSD